jgi:hypothetical protein
VTAPVLDFTRLARQAVRERRRTCDHTWKKTRSGAEACSKCAAAFPCAGFRCHHLDCIERGIELGRRGFPRDFPISIGELAEHHTSPQDDCAACSVDPDGHYRLRTTSDPPETWILPKGWRLQ